jgi:hypothetical protein
MKLKPIYLAIILFSLNIAYGQLRAVKEWSAIYDGPGHGVDLPTSAVLDKRGNFYITGRSSGEGSGQDIAIIRYSASGQEILTLRYNSPANSWDEANSLAVDDSGNIFVAGTSFVTNGRTEIVLIKYTPSGTIAWLAHFSPDTVNSATASKVVFDPIGNIYLGGTFKQQMLVLKYNPVGALMDSITIGDDSTAHSLTDLLVTNNGELYLVGSRSYWAGGDLPTVECAVVKIDTQGNQQWKNYLSAESARSAKLDEQGNLIVITHGDGTTAKYSPDGQLLWYRNSQNSNPSIMLLTGLAIDKHNRIVVSGYGCAVGCFDYMVMKYDGDGNVLWYQSYNSSDTLRDFSIAMALDKFANIYLTGKSAAGYSDGTCLTLKYDSSGNKIWETTFSIAPTVIDQGEFIAIDDSSCVYVGGSSVGSNGLDFLTIKYRQDFENDVSELKGTLPSNYVLSQNFPNPFNPRTTIRYSIPISQFVSLKVHDLLGNEVITLVQSMQRAGSHLVEFHSGSLSSGVYFYRITAGNFVETKKLVVIK